MKTLSEIQTSIEDDMRIDQSDLMGEMLKTPIIFNKYLKWLYEYNVAIGKCETKTNQTIVKRLKYYQGKGTDDEYRRKPFNELITNQKDLQRYLDADDEICAVNERVAEINSIRQMLQDMVDHLRYRNKTIQAVLEHRRFEAGV